ncbi:MAG TPA: hypothetical protein VHX86_10590 [Tepidisphaeraceae bacterium]|jgi:hypothetical protein|nr:hypothetical protein [Tepidisphaeraceae bacterium]
MSDEIIRKYLSRNGGGPPTDPDPESDSDGTEDVGGAFGWVRGVRDRAISLELRKKDGTILAINYSWIERFEFEPSEGITLYAGGKKLTIKGRNLNAETRPLIRLFSGLCRHRVPWVVEADLAAQLKAGPAATVIDQIVW